MIGPTSKIIRPSHSPIKEESIPVSEEKLKNIINRLESDIADNTWFHKDYARMDLKMMPALIAQANHKHPDMNLHFLMSPFDLPEEIEKNIAQGIESARFIINMGYSRMHCCVLDYKKINDKTSLILFEPVNFILTSPALLAVRVETALQKHPIPDCHLSLAEMDIQRSSSECGIFSLALAKKLHTEQEYLSPLHEANINGMLGSKNQPLQYARIDPYLPARFYKHTQSQGRLNEYLNANPMQKSTIVNKKNETLLLRASNNQSEVNGKIISTSAHKKRIAEYKGLLKS
ncbi:YopJ/AvrA family T3SS effector serine/threonine acetyltransferase [unidentified bacterial endosymbiont]|uniref:YopJ/AvrA family T3SS effector serine/threonine acetyltransferase n=1 Tax=unidentified bacterial endosymbiont TaxID=2355 RepID=UPI00209F6967|nr:YopJ/AvrA family T3SS effector serine/threonine acetyltransferase [unidentified bacterial endosymbiont]